MTHAEPIAGALQPPEQAGEFSIGPRVTDAARQARLPFVTGSNSSVARDGANALCITTRLMTPSATNECGPACNSMMSKPSAATFLRWASMLATREFHGDA